MRMIIDVAGGGTPHSWIALTKQALKDSSIRRARMRWLRRAPRLTGSWRRACRNGLTDPDRDRVHLHHSKRVLSDNGLYRIAGELVENI